jgi:large subunit ribosomal protein L15
MANELSKLSPIPGERSKPKRIGRGEGSGQGRTAGRGQKGSKSRAGVQRRARHVGGQMPLHMRLPKRGFRSQDALDYEVLNIGTLAGQAPGSVVTEASLHDAGIISRIGEDGVKILGAGEISCALHVRVAKLSASAREKILAAGGTVEGDLP